MLSAKMAAILSRGNGLKTLLVLHHFQRHVAELIQRNKPTNITKRPGVALR